MTGCQRSHLPLLLGLATVWTLWPISAVHADANIDLAEQVWLAGPSPSQRPAPLPKITQFNKDKAWYAKALTGVRQPYPVNLKFLEQQGGWYTPFTVPGMPPPYDPRQWHGNN